MLKKTLIQSSILSLLVLGTIASSLRATALPPNVKQFVDFETKSNAVATRNNKPIKMPHYEIPLEWMEVISTDKMPKEIYDTLVFEREGKKYVRWVMNPEDTKWHKDVVSWLTRKLENSKVTKLTKIVDKYHLNHVSSFGIEKKYYFTGYQTASRSYIVEDPESKVQFSLKGSTNVTGGNWTDKKQELTDAQDILKVSQYLNTIEKKVGFENFFLLDEPLAIGIKEVDQAIVVRLLNQLPKSQDYIYIPGFSALHDHTGKYIAQINGSNNPEEFWREHYIKVMGKVLAELAAKTGISYDSPHSQNFIIELDKNFKPTGRIGLRDFGDVYLNKKYLTNLNQHLLLETFSEQSNIKDYQSVSFGPLHGNSFPSWVTESIYKEWGDVFFESFETHYSKYTNISKELLHTRHYHNGKYYGSEGYKQDSPEWQNYFARMKLALKDLTIPLCGKLFAN